MARLEDFEGQQPIARKPARSGPPQPRNDLPSVAELNAAIDGPGIQNLSRQGLPTEPTSGRGGAPGLSVFNDSGLMQSLEQPAPRVPGLSVHNDSGLMQSLQQPALRPGPSNMGSTGGETGGPGEGPDGSMNPVSIANLSRQGMPPMEPMGSGGANRNPDGIQNLSGQAMPEESPVARGSLTNMSRQPMPPDIGVRPPGMSGGFAPPRDGGIGDPTGMAMGGGMPGPMGMGGMPPVMPSKPMPEMLGQLRQPMGMPGAGASSPMSARRQQLARMLSRGRGRGNKF
jgi:hypothetical protein